MLPHVLVRRRARASRPAQCFGSREIRGCRRLSFVFLPLLAHSTKLDSLFTTLVSVKCPTHSTYPLRHTHKLLDTQSPKKAPPTPPLARPCPPPAFQHFTTLSKCFVFLSCLLWQSQPPPGPRSSRLQCSPTRLALELQPRLVDSSVSAKSPCQTVKLNLTVDALR